jgi:predicted regulator of Ras-like GTPase activity (Roadblock/LC7/MglB family)
MEVLSQLNTVPGVIGSAAFDAEGRIIAQAFPPGFDPAKLAGAVATLADRTAALESALGGVGMIDLRYSNARILVKAKEGAKLLCLCAPTVNAQLLAMSASAALHKLDKLAGEPPAAGGALYAAVQRVNELVERSGLDRIKARGQIALKAGFSLDLVDPGTPDDPAKLQKLKAAVSAVLGQPI